MSERTPVAVVSGAGSGLGRAVALELARRGHRLALLGRRPEPLRETLAAAAVEGGAWSCDVRRAGEVRSVAAAVAASGLGEVRVLVPAAGTAVVAPLAETPPDDFARVVETNLHGVFHLVQAFLPQLRQVTPSWILPVLSVAARRGLPGWGAYGASKWGLRGLVATLREELAGSGVAITALYAGAIDTPLWDDLAGEWPRERMVPVEEVARAVGWALEVAPRAVLEEVHLGPADGVL
ncbi:MAG TPA: SDR family oxidoreductase [Thermoanaerobaculia bacterium]|nr:SDR family oxidoreductase [Thermoanaerobaculia bacterium]